MRVSGLDASHDWRFGRGKATYLQRGDAVRQNVKTRILSFANDWFLDTDANIDWITLLGSKNTKRQIEREVERVALATVGVASISDLQLVENKTLRSVNIQFTLVTVFDTTFNIDIGVSP